MTPCIQEIAKGIALDCDKALVNGFTGRAVYIPYSVNPTITQSSSNPRIVSAITSSKVVGIYTPFTDPFNGSAVAGTADNGRVQWQKNLAVLIPSHGADESKDLIEPLMKSAEGGLIIVERKDKRGLGSFVVYGLLDPMKADPSTYSRNETDNGGAAALTLGCTEDWEECNFFDTDYATTKAAFDALFAAAI
jgi:hypothetical protein